VVSTDAGAEGVNLQAANVLLNYDLPWNPMIVEQRIGRVQRIGSRYKTVWVANIVHHNSPEQRIVSRLLEKLQVIAHTVGDIEAVLEAAGDAEGTTLEQQIREMVIASLRGQDPDRAAQLAEASIDLARKVLEEKRR
jgi:SNF2 family DNA or RNA helicase